MQTFKSVHCACALSYSLHEDNMAGEAINNETSERTENHKFKLNINNMILTFIFVRLFPTTTPPISHIVCLFLSFALLLFLSLNSSLSRAYSALH